MAASTNPRPTKGERTRRRIVERAAVLFNTRGVAGASMADVSEAAGLEKGGVYNHFESKDALALAAFDYAAALVLDRIDAAIAAHDGDGWAQLLAIVDVYRNVVEKPPIAGGCPLLNTAIEADDTSPVLRARARAALDRWRTSITRAVDRAAASGDLRATDAESIASMTIAAIEGGVMLARVYRDGSHIVRVATELTRYLETYRSTHEATHEARAVDPARAGRAARTNR
jgi:TetR/AcrR family transcriptional repressor of nem operon